jgi:hypothetical protein
MCGISTNPTAKAVGSGSHRFCDDVHRRLRQSRQHLLRPGEVKLSQVGENDEADVEERHVRISVAVCVDGQIAQGE